jgi:hypothetical protein
MCHQIIWGSTNRRIAVLASLGIKQDLISKITTPKGLVELLPVKCKATSSNPNTAPLIRQKYGLWC